MKIAVFSCVFPPYKGGIGKVAFDFSVYLAEQGNEVEVFTPAYKKELSDDGINKQFKLKRFTPWLSLGNAAFSPAIVSNLKKYDLIYLHYPFFGMQELLFLFLIFNRRTKFIIHYHMDVDFKNLFLKLMSLPSFFIKKALFRRADFVTCASIDYLAHSSLSGVYKDNPKKFVEIPFAVDSEYFFPIQNKAEGKIKILFVGGLDKAHYFKGLDVLFKAIFLLENKNNFELDIVGDGDMRAGYEKQVREYGIENSVNFLGPLSSDDLRQVYQEADFFVLPSINKNEAFGIVLLEAMSSGLPVIASDLFGVRKVFRDGIDGFLFKTGDSEDLKDKISILINNKELRSQMSLSARSLVLQKYRIDNIKDALRRLIKKIS